MPRITCLHGHEIELTVEQFGQRIACPNCQLLMTVSPPRPGEQLVPKYEVLCDHGHVLRVKSKYLGTQIRCPQCQGLAWVTTDRLQKHGMNQVAVPIQPVTVEQKSLPHKVMPVATSAPVVTPQALADIPVAEVDETYGKPTKSRVIDDEEEDEPDNAALTKAERRNLKLVDQGLGYWLGGVVGYCAVYLIATILTFLLSLISQGISTMDGHRTLGTISEIIGWIILIAMLLNLMLYLAGNVLTLFTPWITGATIWFLISLITLVGLIGFRLFLMIREGNWSSMPSTFMFGILLEGKWFYVINESIFLVMWLLMVMGLWQLGKFVRKPMTRQRVMLLGLLGSGCWTVHVFFPLVLELFHISAKVAFWILVTFKLILTLGIGGLMIFQHLAVVNEVRSVMHRRK